MSNKNKAISIQLAKLIIQKGNKIKSHRIFKKLLRDIYLKTGLKGIDVLSVALNNGTVYFNFRRQHLGGAAYSIPIIFKDDSKEYKLVLRWLLKFAKNNRNINTGLLNESLEAFNNKGNIIKMKNDYNMRVVKGIPYTKYLT